MKRTFRTLLAIVFCAITACATPLETRHLAVSTVDLMDMRRVEVRYRNDTDQVVCLAVEDWPSTGMVHQGSDRVFLSVGGEKFAIEDVNTGYCVGSTCTARIAPGEEIEGWISYESFGLPERLWISPKTLSFSPAAYICKEVKAKKSF
jgi:hypothetical protein